MQYLCLKIKYIQFDRLSIDESRIRNYCWTYSGLEGRGHFEDEYRIGFCSASVCMIYQTRAFCVKLFNHNYNKILLFIIYSLFNTVDRLICDEDFELLRSDLISLFHALISIETDYVSSSISETWLSVIKGAATPSNHVIFNIFIICFILILYFLFDNQISLIYFYVWCGHLFAGM